MPKSKIPVRMTQLSSGNPKRFSSVDNTVKKGPLLRDSAKEHSSRIPVAVGKKNDSLDKTGMNFH